MATRTVETTAAEDEAITYAYQQSQKPPMGMPPGTAPIETEAQFFERMTKFSTVSPMVSQHGAAKNTELLVTLGTIPPENRDAARTDIEAVVVQYGGTVPLQEVSYLWSSNTAAPPRNNSVEADKTDANLATVTKLTFDDLDAGGVSRMTSLMALKLNTLIRLQDQAASANFLQAVLTAAPIQRQGPDGYVELLVSFHSRGGSFAALDTLPMTCTFM